LVILTKWHPIFVLWLAALTKYGEFRSVFLSLLKFLGKIFRVINKCDAEQMSEEKIFEISSSMFQLCVWVTALLIYILFLAQL
jgi:hypothetical protein